MVPNGVSQEFIQKYTPLIRRMAGICALKCGIPGHIDDLIQEAWMRILKHYPLYQADEGATLKTFLTRHIAGAFLDYLRVIDILGRHDRRLVSRLARLMEDAYGTNRKRLAAAMRMNGKKLEELLILKDLCFQPIYAKNDEEDDILWFDVAYGHAETPEALFVLTKALGRIEREIPGIDKKRSLKMFMRHYLDGVTQNAVAQEFGVSESRICQIVGEIRRIVLEEFEN